MEIFILIIPLFIIFLVAVSLCFAIFKKWKISVLILIFAYAMNLYGEVFPFYPFSSSLKVNDGELISVMAFNIHGPGERFDERIEGIVKIIEKENPDVLFLSEAVSSHRLYKERLDSILSDKFLYSSDKDKRPWGNVFYSKFPIDTFCIIDITIGHSQPLMAINVGGKKLNLLGCHLSSNNYFDSKIKMEVDSVSNKGDVKRYIKSIEKGYEARRQDVDSICTQLSNVEKSQLIILGDMNDIGGSYTIRKLESLGMRDAWWNAGFGLGGTRDVLSIPFRIDHILYGDSLELAEVNVINADGLSDHNAISAKFCIK